MSKKVSIISPGKLRSNLWSIFRSYLIRKDKEEEEYWRTHSKRNLISHYFLYDEDDDYSEEMEKLRNYYEGLGMMGDYPGWDDDDEDYYVDEDGCIIFPIKKSEKKTKHKHTKHRSRHRSKSKVIDIDTPYSGNEESPDEIEGSSWKIYFYPDYHDKYSRIEFNSLSEFDEYCHEEGYTVPLYVCEHLSYNPVSHCCLNPIAKEHGKLEIMSEESYGDMFYEACTESELGI